MDRSTLMLANLLSAGAAALFSWTMVSLVVDNTLQFYLADQKFQILVLIGGVLLGLILLLRLPALFGGESHHHHHDHGDGHTHDHDEHTHAPSLWRLIVLALPLMIIFMGVPRQGFSAQGLTNKLSAEDLKAIAAVASTSLPPGFVPKGEPRQADWKVLVNAANDPIQREHWQAQMVQIVGQAVADPRFSDRFRLMRVKITCCAADAVPLSLTVLGPWDPSWQSGQWVEIIGAVNFVDIGNGGFLPVVHQLRASETEPRPYLQ